MNKIKLIFRGGLDGATPVTTPPTFSLNEGWNEAEIPAPAGILPASLWGQVPSGDPYLVHACMLTTLDMGPDTLFEVRSGAPTQTRVQYTPTPNNTRFNLVRPSDEIRLFAPQQGLIKLELLVESIGGVNELGSRLYEWSNGAARARDVGVRVAYFTQAATLSAWTGTLHLTYDSPDGGHITLPPRSIMPLDVILTVTRKGVGHPSVIPAGGDKLAGGLNAITVQRSVIVMNNGNAWTWSGE